MVTLGEFVHSSTPKEEAIPAARIAKIVLFADGTGNARTAQFRTNVWKLYEALDGRPESGQISYYHDGVGTSSFAPLRLLGGIFGVGLGRNVRALYSFLCRNLRSETDEIHLFGFSRGAFTVRVLAGLIHAEGVRHIEDETELADWVRQAYRRNRQRISLAQVGIVRRRLFSAANATIGLFRHQRIWPDECLRPKIQMLGVWDTVAAYGGPIVEMVRGFDRWVWPLSMPDYRLSDTVLQARHALALDEEREAFLPLPWDEVGSADPDRIKQVWFAGVHSDVGGGYADEGLSSIPLKWMMNEAQTTGLRFLKAAEAAIANACNAWGPMHDSRSGLAVSYRYQPRSINALMGLTPNAPLRDPASGNAPLMKRITVHDCVLMRIRDPDGYAPIVLPTEFDDSMGNRITLASEGRNQIWDLVAIRRWMQRLLLVTCFLAIFTPLYPKPGPVGFIDQGLAAPFGTVLGMIPLAPAWLKANYSGAGTWLMACAALVWVWLILGNRLEKRIVRVSTAMWTNRKVTKPDLADGEKASAAPSRSNWFLVVRRSAMRSLRWQVLPAIFGFTFYVAVFFAIITTSAQLALVYREASARTCAFPVWSGASFLTSEPCHSLGMRVLRNHRYRVNIAISDAWSDDRIATSPIGYTYVQGFTQSFARKEYAEALREGAKHLFGIALRREVSARWFVPIIAIRDPGSRWLYKVVLTPQNGGGKSYYADFTAPAEGMAWIYTNDAVAPWDTVDRFYRNNHGSATVTISRRY